MGLKRVLGLDSYRIAWSWLRKIRRAMVRPGRSPLSGNVEVDEILIGGKEQGDMRQRSTEFDCHYRLLEGLQFSAKTWGYA